MDNVEREAILKDRIQKANIQIPNLSDLIMNQKLFQGYLMGELGKFRKLYPDVLSKMHIETEPAKKYLLEEMMIFHNLSKHITDNYSEEKHQRLDYKYEFYPIIRRLFEAFWRIGYIFEDDKEVLNRWNRYIRQVKIEYSKMWRDIKKQHETIGGFDAILNDLPREMLPSNEKDDLVFGSIKNIMSKCTNIYGDRLDYLYFSYRILSFYSHGNINNAILDNISPTNNRFTTIDIPKILCYIANFYFYLIGKAWPDIFEKHSIKLIDI